MCAELFDFVRLVADHRIVFSGGHAQVSRKALAYTHKLFQALSIGNAQLSVQHDIQLLGRVGSYITQEMDQTAVRDLTYLECSVNARNCNFLKL